MKEAGCEADECYIFGPRPRDKARPDLAIEVVWTSGGLDKLEVYRRLEVGEVWFWKDGVIAVHVLDRDGELGEVGVSDDAAELAFGLEHPGRGPAQRHVAGLPVLDVA